MKVPEIVADWLRSHGYDGLYTDDCGCTLDDLAQCGGEGRGLMHYASLKRSKRLQRMAKLLSDKLPHSTMEIARKANICAVGTAASELRKNGMSISCEYFGKTNDGEKIYHYRILA